MLVDLKVFNSLNKSDNIKVIFVGGWRHCGWQGQPEGGYHGGRWHHDVSLQSKSLGFYSPLLTSVSSFSLMLMSWTLVLSHNLKQSNTFKCSHHQYSLSHPHPHWLKNIQTEVIHYDVKWLSLPSTVAVSPTINTHDLKNVRNVEIRKTSQELQKLPCTSVLESQG